MIRTLETVVPPEPDRPEMAGPDHPMRKVTRDVAFEPGGWTPERAEKVALLFDTLAPEWQERTSNERRAPLKDALARGDVGECAHHGALLRAVVVPQDDGQTGFGDLARAYDALDEETQALLEKIEVSRTRAPVNLAWLSK